MHHPPCVFARVCAIGQQREEEVVEQVSCERVVTFVRTRCYVTCSHQRTVLPVEQHHHLALSRVLAYRTMRRYEAGRRGDAWWCLTRGVGRTRHCGVRGWASAEVKASFLPFRAPQTHTCHTHVPVRQHIRLDYAIELSSYSVLKIRNHNTPLRSLCCSLANTSLRRLPLLS